MSGMIFANRTQIEFCTLTEIFEGMIAYDFIKITCCQKLQKVDFGWLVQAAGQSFKPNTATSLPFS